MTKKKKDHVPRDIEDLERIYYGLNKEGKNVDLHRKRGYEDWLRAQVMSPSFEDYVKEMFAPLGNVEKVPENKKRPTFDFKIDDRRLLLEVTSLNIDETYLRNLSRADILRKLSVVVEHILTKDASQFPLYRKGGVIFYALTFNLYSKHFWSNKILKFHNLLDDKLPQMSRILDNDLDFLVFFHEPASINDKSSWDLYPPVFYVKDGLLGEEFEKAFQGKNYKFMILH